MEARSLLIRHHRCPHRFDLQAFPQKPTGSFSLKDLQLPLFSHVYMPIEVSPTVLYRAPSSSRLFSTLLPSALLFGHAGRSFVALSDHRPGVSRKSPGPQSHLCS